MTIFKTAMFLIFVVSCAGLILVLLTCIIIICIPILGWMIIFQYVKSKIVNP